MKLTLEQPSYARQVTIEVGSDDLTIDEVWEDLIKPALLALSYHPNTVDGLVGDQDTLPVDEGERMRRYHAHPYVSGEEEFPDTQDKPQQQGEEPL